MHSPLASGTRPLRRGRGNPHRRYLEGLLGGRKIQPAGTGSETGAVLQHAAQCPSPRLISSGIFLAQISSACLHLLQNTQPSGRFTGLGGSPGRMRRGSLLSAQTDSTESSKALV